MPFEPRIVHSDDFHGDAGDGREPSERELQLTPDLMELASQLSEEAALLADRYPAGAARPLPRGRWSASRLLARIGYTGGGLGWRGVAAAALVSTAIWGATRDWGAVRQPELFRGPMVRLIDDVHPAPAPQNIHAAPAIRAKPDSALPAAFFQELSGPEREALLDLLEEERLNQSSLSI